MSAAKNLVETVQIVGRLFQLQQVLIQGFDRLARRLEEQPDHVRIVENRGVLDLEVSDIVSNKPDVFSVDKTTMLIPPGGADVVEVMVNPPPDGFSGSITSSIRFLTNDPDSYQNPFELVVITGDSQKIDVGDVVDSSFGFLDPNGAGQVDALKGHVTILAYFALF